MSYPMSKSTFSPLDRVVLLLLQPLYILSGVFRSSIWLAHGLFDWLSRLFEDSFSFYGYVIVPGKNSSVHIRQGHRVPEALSYGVARQQATEIARNIANGDTSSISVKEAIGLYAGGAIMRRQLLSAENGKEHVIRLRVYGRLHTVTVSDRAEILRTAT